jgi:hypothetical protein
MATPGKWTADKQFPKANMFQLTEKKWIGRQKLFSTIPNLRLSSLNYSSQSVRRWWQILGFTVGLPRLVAFIIGLTEIPHRRGLG